MFLAGFARVDITPPLGSPLEGNSLYRPASAILDPLELNCVAFSDGENRAVLITADVLYVMENVASELRELVAKKCAIPADHVFMQGLHQHTSIRVGTRPHVGNIGIKDQPYLDVLYRKYCDVAKLALDDMKESTLEQAERETPEPLSFIRRYLMKDGTCKTNPGKGNPDVVRPLGEADNMVRVLRLRREEAKDIAIVNFSCHPDMIGGTTISADWPGFVRRHTEKTLPDVHCILVNGAQGDTNHIDLKTVGIKTSRSYEYCSHMGKVISDTAVSLWDKTRPRKAGKVWGKVEMKFIPTNTTGIERVEEYKKLSRDIREGKTEKPETAILGEIWRIAELEKELLYQKVPVSVLCLGDVAFVGYGGEPFTHYGTLSREAGKEIYVITACLTNGGQGYLPTRSAFDEGGYEARTSRFTPGVEEELTGAAAELLEEYRGLK